jgi:hypothetical protein
MLAAGQPEPPDGATVELADLGVDGSVARGGQREQGGRRPQ